MGGRKPHSVKKVLGSNTDLSLINNSIRNAIKNKDPKEIAQKTLDSFGKSKVAISHLSDALDMFDVVYNSKIEAKSNSEFREKVSKDWAEGKYKKNLKLDKEIDRIFFDSALKIIKRRTNKK